MAGEKGHFSHGSKIPEDENSVLILPKNYPYGYMYDIIFIYIMIYYTHIYIMYIYNYIYIGSEPFIYIGSEPFFRGVKILPRVAPALSSVRSSVFFWAVGHLFKDHQSPQQSWPEIIWPKGGRIIPGFMIFIQIHIYRVYTDCIHHETFIHPDQRVFSTDMKHALLIGGSSCKAVQVLPQHSAATHPSVGLLEDGAHSP